MRYPVITRRSHLSAFFVVALLFAKHCYAQDEPVAKYRARYILSTGSMVRYLKRTDPADPKAKVEEQIIETTDAAGAKTTVVRKITTQPAADTPKKFEYTETDPKKSATDKLKVTITQKGDTLYFRPWKWTKRNPSGSDVINNEAAEEGRFFRVVGDEMVAGQTIADRNKATAKAQAFNPTIRYYSRSIDVGVIAIPVTVLLHRHSIASVKPNAGIYVGRNLGFTNYYRSGVSQTKSRTVLVYGGAAELDLSKKNTPGISDDDKGEAPFLNFGLGYLGGTTKFNAGVVLGWYVPLSGPGWESRYSEAPYLGLLLSLKISG